MTRGAMLGIRERPTRIARLSGTDPPRSQKKTIPQGSRDCWTSCGTVRCSARWLDACRYPAGECLERAHDQRRREVAVAVVRHAPLQKHIRRASRRHDIGKGWLVKEWYKGRNRNRRGADRVGRSTVVIW